MTGASSRHYTILGVSADAELADVRAAYRALAKRNHPDLFPDAERSKQQLRMMRVNEAYMAVLADLAERSGGRGEVPDSGSSPRRPAAAGGRRHADAGMEGRGPGGPRGGDSRAAFFNAWEEKAKPHDPSPVTAVGELRDPAYAYYKQGFRFYNLGSTELIRKEAPRLRRDLLKERSIAAYDAYVLRFALRALHYFERAYSYFLVVVERYPSSPWSADARWKLRRLEKFSAIYQRICENLSRRSSGQAPERELRRSSTSRSSFSIVRGADPS